MSEHSEKNVATSARKSFAAWIGASPEGRVFGEVLVKKSPDGFAVRHREDAESESLSVYENPREAREISRLTEAGEYRPLKSSPNLRRGWELRLPDDRALTTAMNYLYPAGVVHWYSLRQGRLEVTSFRENAARQSGMYARIQHLSDGAVQDAARACCEDAVCLKKTLWDVDDGTKLEMERGEGGIPCPEPCSVFVAFARKVRSFEKDGIYEDADGLTPSERSDAAALIEAAASGVMESAREAEFDEPLNVRRMRYREITTNPKLRSED